MVKVKRKAFLQWKSTVVHQGRTTTSVRRHNILSSSQDRGGCPYGRASVIGALQAVDAVDQPEGGPVNAKVRKSHDVQAWIDIRASLHLPAVESLCPP